MAPRWLSCVALLIAACSDPVGTTFEIDLPPSTSTVELFIGVEQCVLGNQPCTRIVPEGFTRPQVGAGYFLDTDLAQTVSVSGTQAVIRLFATDAVHLKKLVVVGLDSQGTITGTFVASGLTITPGDAEAWRVALTPWMPVVELDPRPAAGTHVKIWRRQNTIQNACVLIQHVEADGQASSSSFLVPKDDPDCDDVVRDCDPLWNRAPPTDGQLSAASCFTTDAHGSCRLAGPTCTEQGGGIAACVPTTEKYCAPESWCKTISCLDRPFRQECAENNLTQNVHQTCQFSVGANNDACESNGFNRVTFDASAYLMAAGALDPRCIDVGLRDLSPATPTQPFAFQRSAVLSTGSPGSNAEFEVNLTGMPCMVELKWKQGSMQSNDGLALIDLETSVGHVIVPLNVNFRIMQGVCNEPPSCMPPSTMMAGSLTACLAP